MHAQFSAEGGESAASGAAIGLGIDLGVGRAGKEAGSGVAPGILCQPFGGQGGVLRGAGNCRVQRLGQGDGVGGCGDEQKPGEYDMPGVYRAGRVAQVTPSGFTTLGVARNSMKRARLRLKSSR